MILLENGLYTVKKFTVHNNSIKRIKQFIEVMLALTCW